MLIGKRNNNLLWDIQASLCVLYVMGGVTKTFMLDKIAERPPPQRPYLTAFGWLPASSSYSAALR